MQHPTLLHLFKCFTNFWRSGAKNCVSCCHNHGHISRSASASQEERSPPTVLLQWTEEGNCTWGVTSGVGQEIKKAPLRFPNSLLGCMCCVRSDTVVQEQQYASQLANLREVKQIHYISLICNNSVTTRKLAFLSYWYRKKRFQLHF